MVKLLFSQRVQEALCKERGAITQHQMVDAVQMVVARLIAGATASVTLCSLAYKNLYQNLCSLSYLPPNRLNNLSAREIGNDTSA